VHSGSAARSTAAIRQQAGATAAMGAIDMAVAKSLSLATPRGEELKAADVATPRSTLRKRSTEI